MGYTMGVVRILLALAVMLYHASNRGILDRFISGPLAVQCFFIISGFYMALVLCEKYTDVRSFYFNRFLRLYPVYWLVLALVAAGELARGKPTFISNILDSSVLLWDGKLLMLSANLTMFGSDAMMFLFPGPKGLQFTTNFLAEAQRLFPYHAIAQAWSLPLEMMFYGLAPFLVHRKARLFLAMLASLCLRWWVYTHVASGDPWSYRFFPTELLFFCAGALAYHAYSSLNTVPYTKLGGGALVVVAVICISQSGRFATTFVSSLPVYLFIVSALPFMFLATRTSTIDRWIGEMSYPFYLTHPIALSVFGGLLLPSIGCTLLLSALINRYVQEPVEARFKWRSSIGSPKAELSTRGNSDSRRQLRTGACSDFWAQVLTSVLVAPSNGLGCHLDAASKSLFQLCADRPHVREGEAH